MFKKATALFLALVIGFGVIIPLATEQAEAGARKIKKHRKHAKYKKYSKGWWRQYRARMKRKRAMQAAKRALRLRQIRMEKTRGDETAVSPATPKSKPVASKTKKADASKQAVAPSSDTQSELQFRVDNGSGDQIGSASISYVGPSMQNGGRQSVGGMSTSTLRRGVIEKMIKENGWVVNDYQKEISGQQVYVVVAQSQGKNGGVQSRMFFFTEVDGQVYNVATNSPIQESERLAEESEKVINSLRSRVRPTQRASNK